MRSDFAKQYGIPEIPDDRSCLRPIAGRFVRSLSELTGGKTVDASAFSPPGHVPVSGGTISGAVMFIDIGKFTARSRDLSPGQTAYWVNQFFYYQAPRCERYRATFDKAIGDCLMFVLSRKLGCRTPLASAFKLAIDILTSDVRGYWPHIGIAAGRFWIGHTGPPHMMTISVFGDVVNLASRLASADDKSGEKSVQVALESAAWSCVRRTIRRHGDDWTTRRAKGLSDFPDQRYVVIGRAGSYHPQFQLPPLTIGREIRCRPNAPSDVSVSGRRRRRPL